MTIPASEIADRPERQIDLGQARRFLQLLAPGETTFTFQTFDDRDEPRYGFAEVFHGTLEQHADELIKRNQAGAGVFVMVNKGDGIKHPGERTCRTNKNVITVRAQFLDLDGAPLEPVLEASRDNPPHIIVQSSAGKWHVYWRVNDCALEDFTARQLALADKFDGDKTVKDVSRVMRLPGFLHQKVRDGIASPPFMTHLLDNVPEKVET